MPYKKRLGFLQRHCSKSAATVLNKPVGNSDQLRSDIQRMQRSLPFSYRLSLARLLLQSPVADEAVLALCPSNPVSVFIFILDIRFVPTNFLPNGKINTRPILTKWSRKKTKQLDNVNKSVDRTG
ncbi:hypothetical protein [Amphritea sp. HPY]|uniref:hypothetical protein n=1 Tax=Amphritea sp. HPY TaxID=3421652 RepID=UPI003D7ECE2B